MTTDIIELAQREKFEAWFKSSFHPDKTGPYIKDQLYFAWKAAGAELVEALEKAQQLATQQGNIACALFDEVTAQRQRIAELESQLKAAENNEIDARCHIADLESRTVKLPKPHAHLIWIQAGHAPDDYWDDVAVSHSEKDLCCDGSERYPVYARWEIEEMLAAAGIKVEAE
ncbi:hypothetical protein [Klebsiella pneumoniae]|uniref:hypothetical protein n=1 Tax=Klebsiella pneumoniae TaxID=573 RepID=UPI000E2D6314|nr:hypothetical protein [Klebsiella pneumoniae]SXK00588.1 Uncharacterised protein [Klebsiella pneumoniae]